MGQSKLLLIKSSHKIDVNSLFLIDENTQDSERFSSLVPKISMEYWNLYQMHLYSKVYAYCFHFLLFIFFFIMLAFSETSDVWTGESVF